ncbi:MAG: hypothetical protein ACLU38_07600 [Dysosmobacter sp.]
MRLPQVGGLYVQMEDELGSMADHHRRLRCWQRRLYTATSGPGFSLMQENLGVAVMGEIPCVIVDVMRSGPSTGMATKPAQGDLLQAKWGTHGDHGLIVISPASVQECYDYMITAFNYSEKHRTPVVFLADEVVGHMRETYVKWEVGPEDVVERKSPVCAPADYKPYDFSGQSEAISPPGGLRRSTRLPDQRHHSRRKRRPQHRPGQRGQVHSPLYRQIYQEPG